MAIKLPAGGAAATDPDFASVSLLLHMDGSDGSTTFTDSSAANRTATRVGSPVISTSQSKFGGASGLFNGSGDYVRFPDSEAFNFADGDFTIEAWIRLAAHPASYAGAYAAAIISQDDNTSGFVSNGWYFSVDGNSSQNLGLTLTSDTSVRVTITGAANFALDTWYHVAAVRDGNMIYLYKDGVLLNSGGTAYTSLLRNAATTVKVGALDLDVTYKYWFNGRLDDLRVTKGVSRYPGGTTFTPPTAAHPTSGAGSTGDISALYLGSTAVSAAYLGSSAVYNTAAISAPSDITGIQLWLNAADAVISGNSVLSWPSRTGGFSLTVGTGNPTYSENGFNGYPQVQFAGYDAMRSTAAVLARNVSDEVAIIAVVRPSAVPSSNRFASRYAVLGGESTNTLGHYLSLRIYGSDKTYNSSITKAGASDDVANSGTLVAVERKFHAMTFDAATVTNYLNNSTAGTASLNLVSSATPGNGVFTLGGMFSGGSFLSDFFADVDVAEVLIYDRALTANEITSLYDYYNAMYALE